MASLSVPSTGGVGTAMGSDYHCPECGLRDDGSPMIGCDGCDSWVHWMCVGITRDLWPMRSGSVPLVSRQGSRERRRKEERERELATECASDLYCMHL